MLLGESLCTTRAKVCHDIRINFRCSQFRCSAYPSQKRTIHLPQLWQAQALCWPSFGQIPMLELLRHQGDRPNSHLEWARGEAAALRILTTCQQQATPVAGSRMDFRERGSSRNHVSEPASHRSSSGNSKSSELELVRSYGRLVCFKLRPQNRDAR